jgi:hypothetical protein
VAIAVTCDGSDHDPPETEAQGDARGDGGEHLVAVGPPFGTRGIDEDLFGEKQTSADGAKIHMNRVQGQSDSLRH